MKKWNNEVYNCMFLSCHVRVNCSIVAWMSRNSLLEVGVKSEGEVTTTGLKRTRKWLSVHLRTKWFWVRVQLQSLHQVYSFSKKCFLWCVLQKYTKYQFSGSSINTKHFECWYIFRKLSTWKLDVHFIYI